MPLSAPVPGDRPGRDLPGHNHNPRWNGILLSGAGGGSGSPLLQRTRAPHLPVVGILDIVKQEIKDLDKEKFKFMKEDFSEE